VKQTWQAYLAGQLPDLEDLIRWTSGNQLRVEKRAERYLLVMPTEIVGDAPEGVHARAAEYLDLLNGFGSIHEATFEPVALGTSPLELADRDGKVLNTVVGISGVRARVRGGRPTVEINGVPLPDRTKGIAECLLSATQNSNAAKDAILILGRRKPTWSELYVGYELVKANTKGSVAALGWIGDGDLKLFKRTVNSYSALGAEARHGLDNNPPPRSPMTYDRALELIRALVRQWLAAQTSPLPP